MSADRHSSYTAFDETKLLASGDLRTVVTAVKARIGKASHTNILVFEDQTGRTLDLDWRGDVTEVLERMSGHGGDKKSGPGRPKLGVVSREISLLPRHWEWLMKQPGGASVTLRKLVEEAKRKGSRSEVIRMAQEATYRFMNTMAGDFAGFEAALRALYADDALEFNKKIANWPADLRNHIQKMARPIWVEAGKGTTRE